MGQEEVPDTLALRDRIRGQPLSLLFAAACVAVFVGLHVTGDAADAAHLSRWGWRAAEDVWHGDVWALLTSALLHVDVIHLGLNVYWLWILGRDLEQVLPRAQVAVFLVFAAWVSSAVQLAIGGDLGIGASGVVYAMFGLLWVVARHEPAKAPSINEQTIRLFLGWLVFCWALTILDLYAVGNAAHLSGLAIGLLAGGAFARPARRALWLTSLAATVLAASASLLGAPWSGTWTAMRAYDAHDRGDFDDAVVWYERTVDLGHEPAWALGNLVRVQLSMGHQDEARATMARLQVVDPTQARALIKELTTTE